MEPLDRILEGLGQGRIPGLLVTRFETEKGEDLLGRDALLRAVRRAVLGDAPEVFGETVFDGTGVDLVEVLDAAREVSLLAPRRLVLVRGAKLAAGAADEGGEGSEGEDPRPDAGASPAGSTFAGGGDRDAPRLALLQRYLSGPQDVTCILFLGCPWDGRRRIHKAVLAAATQVDLTRPDIREIPGWIETTVRRAGGAIDREAVQMLAELRGNDTLRIASEIDKLLLHRRANETVTREDVLALVGAGEATSAWALSEALADGDAALAVQALRRLLAEGESAPLIVGALAARLRQLVVLRDERTSGRTNDAARKIVFPGRSSYFADSLARKAARFPPDVLDRALASLYEVDRSVKSSPSDPGALLETWLHTTLRSGRRVRSS